MRIVFMGTPDFASTALRALHEAGHDIAAVYSQPPRPSGRGKKLQRSAVHELADDLGLTVLTPTSLKGSAEQAEFAAHEADIAVVAAYGLLLPRAILNAPRHGCLNIHASLLPRWRGAAPIHRAIMAGDQVTGVTIMHMEEGLDTGPMLARVETEIGAKTTGDLTSELAQLGAELMVQTLNDLPRLTPVEQDGTQANYAAKISKAEAQLDWSLDAAHVVRCIHALAPFPGAWTEIDGQRVKFLRAEVSDTTGPAGEILDEHMTIGCQNGAIRPLQVQKSGKPAMDTTDFLRGNRVPVGMRLT